MFLFMNRITKKMNISLQNKLFLSADSPAHQLSGALLKAGEGEPSCLLSAVLIHHFETP